MINRKSLGVMVLLWCAGPARTEQDSHNVMQPTLPGGTIVLINPRHPSVKVDATRSGDVTVIEGALARPSASISADISDWQFCRSDGAICRQFHVRLLRGSAVVAGPIGFHVRKAGGDEWIKLETRPGPSKFIGSYREFDGFAAIPFFLTVNCAVQDHELMSWEVRNWSASAIEFRIEVPVKACPAVKEAQDDAD